MIGAGIVDSANAGCLMRKEFFVHVFYASEWKEDGEEWCLGPCLVLVD